MDKWIAIAQWFVAVVGTLIVLGALLVGGMAWLLNHPD